MNETCDFLKECETYYLATAEGDCPRVRPFGTAHIFENRLYLQTGKVKEVYKQLKKNPNIEISGMAKGKWIRLQATAVEDDRVAPRQSMLDAYPELQGMYKADDENTAVFYLEKATATFCSFADAPKTVTF